ncbi:MAG: deoxyhypusine synthase family protein, partial [Nanoarchaeota archaeon]|nr:deoxyhypusine synthase family protein [Nanoarchaeota archaeon]
VDSGLGMQVWSNKIKVDPFKDWDDLVVNQVWSAKKTGVIILGGGVPKNFILQAQQFSDKEHGYAVQITMASIHDGGLSGAELREAVSWGKIGKNSLSADVRSDVTIVLPLIVDYLKKKKVKR